MSNNIFVIAEHLNGQVEDITYEMLGKAKELSGSNGGEVIGILLGNNAEGLASDFNADKVIYIENEVFSQFNPEAYSKTISALVNEHSPQLTLVGNTSQGYDIAAAVSVDCDMPLISYVSDITSSGLSSQLYGGKMSVESETPSGKYIASILPGSFDTEAGKGTTVIEKASGIGLDDLKIKFTQLINPEGGDVDITQHDILVSVGRGIQNEDNLEIVKELADKLGGALSSSRPIVDSKWLPKTRQVGKSGLKVKPKIYIAVGISGAPEHIEGMKDAECIIAINTDPNAPIFDYAHYGVTEDLFDVVPALTEKL